MILIVYAHPHHSRSIAHRALLDAVRDLPDVQVNSLYDRYPDFDIDVEAEQAQLAQASLVVWQHPIYWYSPPALLKLWFEVVLMRGWAYGTGGTALRGKGCLWVTSTGSAEEDYRPGASHGHPFTAFVPAVERTAVLCGMAWQPPLVVHGAHRVDRSALAAQAAQYRLRLEQWNGHSHG
jgi:glutathione-regulated potassium-efflux system ancillary protein KefF